MVHAGFLDSESRRDLIEHARDGTIEHWLARRANALLLLDKGWSCERAAAGLYLDDETIRAGHWLYEQDGIEGLAGFGHEGSACRLSAEEQEKLKEWVTQPQPRSTRQIGAWIETEFDIVYRGRSGLIALLLLGKEHRKPQAIPRKLNEAKQKASLRNTTRC